MVSAVSSDHAASPHLKGFLKAIAFACPSTGCLFFSVIRSFMVLTTSVTLALRFFSGNLVLLLMFCIVITVMYLSLLILLLQSLLLLGREHNKAYRCSELSGITGGKRNYLTTRSLLRYF